jgi:hypothetical protein
MDDDGIIKENDSTTMVVLETTTITEEEPEVSKPAAPAAAAPAPTQPKRLSTLYLPTKSSLTKQRHTDGDDLKSTLSGSQKFKSTTSSSASSSSSSAHRAATAAAPRTPRGLGKSHKQQQQQLHGGIKRGLTLTVPVTPKFLTDARMRMAHKERPLTTEERELQAVDEARKAEQQRMLKIKRVFHRVQVRVRSPRMCEACLAATYATHRVKPCVAPKSRSRSKAGAPGRTPWSSPRRSSPCP